jgi:hypothetical protein
MDMVESKADNDIAMVMLENRDVILTEVQSEDTTGPIGQTRIHIFITPALVIAQRGLHGSLGLQLTPWLPYEIMSGSHIEYRKDKIIGILQPNPHLVTYYKSWAKIERDKQVEFGKDFASQIGELQEYHDQKYARTKQMHQEENAASPVPNQHSALTPIIYQMFDEDKDWGDSGTTH